MRLLLVGLAFVIFNLYISLRQNPSSALKKSFEPAKRYWLCLLRMSRMLAGAIESLWGIEKVLQIPPCLTFS
jgi:hypothetical protein